MWLPIETAPTETGRLGIGQPILVTNGSQQAVVRWRESDSAGEDWWNEGWLIDGTGEDLAFTPTHWMPLPEPPAKQQ